MLSTGEQVSYVGPLGPAPGVVVAVEGDAYTVAVEGLGPVRCGLDELAVEPLPAPTEAAP